VKAQAIVASLLAGLATGLGALVVVLVPNFSRRLYDTLLGFSAGVMLGAATLNLLMPALELGRLFTVVLGLVSGALLVLWLERNLPRLEPHFAPTVNGPGKRLGMLMAAAMTLHNLPEGLAVGVAFTPATQSLGIIVALAIALQNVPEGLAVAAPLRAAGCPPWAAVFWGTASGLTEPLAAAVGVLLVGLFGPFVPYGLALAAGAMIYVVSDQLIPEIRSNPKDKIPSLALVLGFLIVTILTKLFG